jgi:uncharacterized protein YqeY
MLTTKIDADMKDALRAKETLRLSTLRMLKSALGYAKMEKKQETLTDADVIAVIKKQIKQRQDAIEGFQKGNRSDLVEKETAELAVLKTYLPPELSPAELEQIVNATIAELGATTKADMGNVMKAIQAKVAGRADNRALSQLVSAKLI